MIQHYDPTKRYKQNDLIRFQDKIYVLYPDTLCQNSSPIDGNRGAWKEVKIKRTIEDEIRYLKERLK